MTESPLAEYDTQIADLHAQMKPLQDRLRAVAEERRAYADLLSEDTDDPQTLAALREASQVAYRKFEAHVRSTTHTAIWNFTEWLPIEDDYSTGYLLGPHLTTDRMSTDADDLAALAGSMTDLAARFCNPAPELVEWRIGTYAGVDLCGMVYAAVLAEDHGEDHAYALFYTPDGSRAVLLDSYALGETLADGSLVHVLDDLAERTRRRY